MYVVKLFDINVSSSHYSATETVFVSIQFPFIQKCLICSTELDLISSVIIAFLPGDYTDGHYCMELMTL